MNIRVKPKERISEKFVVDYYNYTTKQALQDYINKFDSFNEKELILEYF